MKAMSPTTVLGVPLGMFPRRKNLKVLKSIISFVAVHVMNLMTGWDDNASIDQHFPVLKGIPIFVGSGMPGTPDSNVTSERERATRSVR